jgi:hypothetical protein
MQLCTATAKSNGSMYGMKKPGHSLLEQKPSLTDWHVALAAADQVMST